MGCFGMMQERSVNCADPRPPAPFLVLTLRSQSEARQTPRCWFCAAVSRRNCRGLFEMTMLHDLILRNNEYLGVADVARQRGLRFVRLVVEQNGAQERTLVLDGSPWTKQVPLSIRVGLVPG